jgi:endonuclease YncB( thermonuclease family)
MQGKVVGVSDGDTISVLYRGKAEKVRLRGIDAPEKKQPFGERAKQFTSAQAFGKSVTVQVDDIDRYGRYIGIVTLPDGSVLNGNIVRVGLAWWYRQYAPDAKLLGDYEQEARKARRGLWADKAPVAPWAWQQQKKINPPSSNRGAIEWLDNQDPDNGYAVNFNPAIKLSDVAKASDTQLKRIRGRGDTGGIVETLPIGKTTNNFFLDQVGEVSVSVRFDFQKKESVGDVLKAIAVFVRDDYLTRPKKFRTGKMKFTQVPRVTRLVWLPSDEWWTIYMEN